MCRSLWDMPATHFTKPIRRVEKREVDGGSYSGLFKKKFVSDNTLYATIATSMRRVSWNSYETKERCEFHENRLKVRSLCFSSFSFSSSFLLLHPRASFSWQLSTRRVEKYFPTDFRRDYGKTFSAGSFASSSFVPPSSSVFLVSSRHGSRLHRRLRNVPDPRKRCDEPTSSPRDEWREGRLA